MIGWIKLHRSIHNHWIFKEKRKFSKFEAWIDLLLLVNHKDNTFLLGNELTRCKRGMYITSIRELCSRWNWSNSKVRNYLNLLKDEKMIRYFSDTKKTAITIENYNYHQDDTLKKDTQKHYKSITEKFPKHTNKNDKNDKNEKEIYIPIVEYLNKKTGNRFSHRTKSTIEKIDARIKENYSLDDFKKVIENKADHWLEDQTMNRYLRPETLFGNNFESYLNEVSVEELALSHGYNPYAHLEVIE